MPVSGGPGAPRDPGDRAEERPREQPAAPSTKKIRVSAAPRAPGGGSGKPVEVGRTVKLGKKVDQGMLDADSDAEINRRLTAQEQADRDAGWAKTAGEAADAQLARQEREVSADEIKLQGLRDDYARRQSEIDDERTKVDAMDVDEDRLFGEGVTFSKIMAGISILAGGVLQGLKGLDKNPALEAINKAKEDDVRAQKEQIARRRQGLEGKETELERLMRVYGNPEVAERELRARQDAYTDAWVKRTMMDAPEDVQANYQTWLADREQQRTRERIAIDQAAQDDVAVQYRSWGAGGGSGAAKGSAGSQKALALIRSARAGLDKLSATHQKYGAPGTWKKGGLGSSEASKELSAQVNAITAPLDMALQGGGAPNKDTMEQINSTLLSSSGEQTTKAIHAYKQQLDELERAYAGGTAPEAPAAEADE